MKIDKLFLIFTFFFLTIPIFGANRMINKATLILINGKVITMDEKNLKAEGVVISDNKIMYVGSNEDALRYRWGGATVIDLKGATVIPGLSDAHVHLVSLGKNLSQLNLVGTTSKEEILRKAKEAIKKLKEGEWLIGRGWDQNDWEVKEFPTAEDLDKVSKEVPIFLIRIDGHAAWVNTKALNLANINENTPNPTGGKILREEGSRKPTGVLIDNAMDIVSKLIPKANKQQLIDYVNKAMKQCVEKGLTMVHEAGANLEEIQLYKNLYEEKKLLLRIYVMISDDKRTLDYYLKRKQESTLDDYYLIVRGVKLFADGAMGSRGAAFFEPYNDDPNNSGLMLISEERLTEIGKKALKNGWQIAVHAIGDKANNLVLKAYSEILPKNNQARFRIEHAQVVREEDIRLFSDYNIIASMQPIHATSDMYWAEDRIGPKRIRNAYAWRNFLNKGVIIAGGSDAPVEEINPFLGIYAAVSRKDLKGFPERGWYPEQSLNIWEALRIFTINPAYAAFMEDIKGRIKAGYLADLTVIDKDITDVAAEEIPKIKVLMTIVNGKIVWAYGNTPPR